MKAVNGLQQKLSAIRPRTVAKALGLVLLGLLLITALVITSVLTTETGSRWLLARVSALVNNLPDQQLSLDVSAGSLVGGLDLENLTYSSTAVRVAIDQAEIGWNPFALLSGRLAITGITLDNTRVELLPSESPPEPAEPPPGALISFAPLPIAISIDSLTVNNLSLNQADQEFRIDRIRLSASLENQDLGVTELLVDSELASLTGDLALSLRDNLPLRAGLDWRYPDNLYPGSGPAAGNLSLDGDLGTLSIEHRLLQPFQLTSSGRLDPGLTGSDLAIDLTHRSDSLVLSLEQTGTIELEDLALATAGGIDELQLSLTTDLNGDRLPPASISAAADWQSGELEISDFTLTTATGRIDSAATLTFDAGLAGTLEYQLTESTPLTYYQYIGDAGSAGNLPVDIANLNSNGNIVFSSDDSGLNASLQIGELGGDLGDYPFSSSGQISFSNGALQFDRVRLSTTDNQLLINGTLAENLNFAWQIDAPRLDQFLAGLDGQLSASGELAGTLANLQVNSTVALDNARYSGADVERLRLTVSLRDDLLDGQLTIDDASLQTGEQLERLENLTLQVSGSETSHTATLAAQSSLGSVDLRLQGGFSDLASLAWSGDLTGGRLDTPIGEWRTQSATGIAVNDSAAGYLANIEESCWQQASARLCLTFTAGSSTSDSTMRLSGQLRDYPLSVLNHPNNRPPELSFQLDAIPQLPEAIDLGGTIDGDFLVTLDPSRTPAVEASVLPRNLAVTIQTDDPASSEATDPESGSGDAAGQNTTEIGGPRRVAQNYLLLDPSLTASLVDGRWDLLASTGLGRQALNESASAPERGGALETRLSMAADTSLEGAARLDLDDIGWLSALLPDSGNAAGRLAGDLSVTGTLSAPVFDIAVSLSDGLAEIPQLGIVLTDVNTRIDSSQNGPIEITAGARSGQGNLQLQGRLVEPLSEDRHLEANLSGQDFRLADNPDLGVEISPSLQVSASDQRIQVTGDLDIPVLNFTLRQLPEQAVDVSRDAVIVDHPPDRPELARSVAAEQGTLFNVPIIADININLGEDVSLNGFGFTSQVAGNLNVRQQANGTNLTYGELEIVQGDYEMYGQSLQIRGGKLLFFGAYDNPALDIRATRTVSGTTVGVLMNGTVKNIRSQLFSTPALPDSDIIAIMATGKPFSEIGQGEGDRDAMLGSIARLGLNRTQGLTNQVREQLGLDTLAITNTGSINNTTLTVGKFITPDIFLRYGIGLFDNQSKLSLDYTLTERITLQAETGEYQSVDVIYRVER